MFLLSSLCLSLLGYSNGLLPLSLTGFDSLVAEGCGVSPSLVLPNSSEQMLGVGQLRPVLHIVLFGECCRVGGNGDDCTTGYASYFSSCY